MLLGDPVEHSLSPAIHRAALKVSGVAGNYRSRQVDAQGMERAAAEMRRGELDGANITMPHKHLAYRLADTVDSDAERAGSVNTWVRVGAVVEGHTTDVAGVREVWTLRGLPAEGPVLILGSGGAAAATVVALADKQLLISARTLEGAWALARRCGVEVEILPWGTAVDRATVVNCTPLGMRGESLPGAVVSACRAVLDMTYGIHSSPVISWAKANELPHADGIDLLVSQAVASFRLWTGKTPPRQVMEEVARNRSSQGTEGPNQRGHDTGE